jgi:hypothetical protein
MVVASPIRQRDGATNPIMDDRALQWLHLLPCGAQLRVGGELPPVVRQLVGTRADAAGDTLLVHQRLPGTPLAQYRAVVVLHPTAATASQLRDAGLDQQLAYTAIPSFADPRILVPTGNRRVTLRSLDLLATYRRTARLKRIVLDCLARAGQVHRAGDALLLARRSPSRLELLLEQLLDLPRVHLALAPGAPGEFRKLTLQVMTARGQVAAFAKLAASERAREAVERENRVLGDLAGCHQLHGRVPTLIGAIELEDALVIAQTAGGGRIVAPRYSAKHHEFLALVADATERRVPFSQSLMWRSMQTTFETIETHLSRASLQRIRSVLSDVDQTLGSTEITLGLAHRDFGPWNSRIQPDGTLFVFDWESAQHEMVPLYDFFDFQIRSHVLRDQQTRPIELAHRLLELARKWFPKTRPDQVRAYLLAYLADRVLSRSRYAVWRADDSPDVLLTLLTSLLDSRGAWLSTG